MKRRVVQAEKLEESMERKLQLPNFLTTIDDDRESRKHDWMQPNPVQIENRYEKPIVTKSVDLGELKQKMSFMKIDDAISRKSSETILVNVNSNLLSYFVGDEKSEQLFQNITERGIPAENKKVEESGDKTKISVEMRSMGWILDLDEDRVNSSAINKVSRVETVNEKNVSLREKYIERRKLDYGDKIVYKRRERRPVSCTRILSMLKK